MARAKKAAADEVANVTEAAPPEGPAEGVSGGEVKVEKKKRRKKRAAKKTAKAKPVKSDATVEPKAKRKKRKGKKRAKATAAGEATPAVTGAEAAAGKVNKTAAVKKYLEQHPKAGPSAISEALKAQGIDVSVGYASGIKFKLNLGRKRARRAAKEAVGEAAPSAASAPAKFSLDTLLAAKKLAESLGGVEAARAAIAALARITG